MKTSFKHCALATIAILLCSCNKEITPDAIESQVQISAKITPSIVTRVTDDGTAFSNGDAIKVQNLDRESKNLATYTYSSNTGKWSTSDELYWDGESENTFSAWYPVDAEYSSFTIPSDQTTGTAAADWMTATTSAKKAEGNVELSFNHNLAKVTVVIEKWSNEYTANEKVVNSLELNSLSSTMSNDGSLSGDNVAKWIKTNVSQANTSYVALIAPGTYTSAADIMQVYVNGSATALKVKTTSAVVVESGKAYNFKLTIGKDLAEISSSVTVGEWDDEALDDQQATAEVIKKIDYIDEYGVNHGKGVEIDGVIWAPVNCGYHATDFKYGKLYQWGRKYGQGYSDENYSDAIAPVIESTTPTLEEAQSIDNQNVYYNGSSDWYSGSRTIQLWNEGTEDTPIKSSNDPCPTGWRVPTKTELYALTDNYSEFTQNVEGQFGYYFSGCKAYSQNISQIFLPAAGWRNYGNASMTSKNQYRDESGCYYSSTLPESSSYRIAFTIDFGSNGVDTPPNSAERANAFSVRCVQDLTSDSETPSIEPEEDTYIDEYGINHGAGVEIDGVTWAPVNCGYHETDYPYGKLYQWGRKYGQSHDDTEVEVVAGPISAEEGQMESNTNKHFYLTNSQIYHWDINNSYNLWPSEENDPCPNGWHVPSSSDLTTLSKNFSAPSTHNGQKGFWLSGTTIYSSSAPQIFLPAAGYRQGHSYPTYQFQNEVGIYWSCSGSKDNNGAKVLDIRYNGDDDEQVMIDRYAPCSAYSVRCVKNTNN